MRVTWSDADAPAKARSVSGSRKLPVVVFTGSIEKPVVGWAPYAVGGSICTSDREALTPAACSAAASAESATVETAPSPPAAAKASAIVFAQVTSCSFAASHWRNAVTTPSASMCAQEHFDAKSASLPDTWPGLPSRAWFNAADPVANERRSDGRADDVPPPPPPPAPGFGVCRGLAETGGAGNDGGFVFSTCGIGS